MTNIKTVLILPYFGKLPEYFNLYLTSCQYNPQFDWLLLTDDKTHYDYPSNVKVIYTTFDEIKERIKNKFDFPVSITYPHKLCDYKPAYGYIFEDLISGYDFWGHCDPDCILGNLSKYITCQILLQYDKIFIMGHLTLYRNSKTVNHIFQIPLNGKERYKEVYQSRYGCIFDEQNNQSINDIIETTNHPHYKVCCYADIDPYYHNFRLSIYDLNNYTYFLENVKKQIFFWRKGELFRLHEYNGNVEKEEFGYIHLQKRKMRNTINNISNGFIIVPNQFLPFENIEYSSLFKKYYKQHVFNFQFFRTKWNSFKFRLNCLKNKLCY